MVFRASFIGMVLALTGLLSACGKDDGNNSASTTATPDGTASESAASPADADSRPDTPTTAPRPGFGPRRAEAPVIAEVTGVSECDRFLDRYRSCLQRVPEAMRSGLETALEAWHGTWKTMAASPTMHGELAAMCTRTADNAWAAVAQYNCPR